MMIGSSSLTRSSITTRRSMKKKKSARRVSPFFPLLSSLVYLGYRICLFLFLFLFLSYPYKSLSSTLQDLKGIRKYPSSKVKDSCIINPKSTETSLGYLSTDIYLSICTSVYVQGTKYLLECSGMFFLDIP